MPTQNQRLLDYKRTKAELLKAIKEIELIESGNQKVKTLSKFLATL